MAFDSLTAFVVMEGHGPYVWTCYGVFFLLLGALVFWSLHQRRQVMAAQRRELSRTGRDQSSTSRPVAIASFSRVNDSQD